MLSRNQHVCSELPEVGLGVRQRHAPDRRCRQEISRSEVNAAKRKVGVPLVLLLGGFVFGLATVSAAGGTNTAPLQPRFKLPKAIVAGFRPPRPATRQAPPRSPFRPPGPAPPSRANMPFFCTSTGGS